MSFDRTLAPASLAFWLTLPALCAGGCAGGDPPPRAVIILVDTLRRDALGCYGAELDPSPVVDGLAAEGVRFDQAISTSGWTLPSVASLMTATWPSVHKAMGKSSRLTPISEDLPTAAEVFSDAGFATLAIANAAFLSPVLGLERGFDEFDHRHAFNDRIRRAKESVDTALGLASEHMDEPMLLVVHLFDPHLDYDPLGKFADRFVGDRNEPPLPLSATDCSQVLSKPGEPPNAQDLDYIRSAYLAEVAYTDAQIGRLCEGLRELGMYDESWIVVTADHGEEFWDHGGFEHGHTLYDELVRVPLVIKPPASRGRPLGTVDRQVRIIDVMPTLLDAFGVEAPASFLGQSLLPMLSGEDRLDRLVLCESTLYGSDRVALRNGRYKYVLNRAQGAQIPEELYDWRTDPEESRNLISSRRDLAQDMRAELHAFQASIAPEVERTRVGAAENISPKNRELWEKSLEQLGYTGRDDDDEDDGGASGGH